MNIVYAQHEGSQPTMPNIIEITPTMVYLRRNIEQITREEDGVEVTLWSYEEACLTRSDYAIYAAELAQANVEYVAVMSDIDLDV